MTDNQPSTKTDLVTTDKNLTDKNILFLHHLKSGKGTVEAYELAGYKGSAHAAYELRSSLKAEIAKMLEGEGIGTKEGMLLRLKQLKDLPMVQSVVGVKEALEILKFEAKLQPKEEREHKPTITPIIINVHGSADIKAPIEKAVDITPVDL